MSDDVRMLVVRLWEQENPETERRHVLVSLMAGPEPLTMMLSVRGLPAAQWDVLTPAQLDACFPPGSPYLVVYREQPGRVLRGSVTAKGSTQQFKPMSTLAAARLAGGHERLKGMERWLQVRAAEQWPGMWTVAVKKLPPLDIDLIRVDLASPVDE